MCRFVAYLGEPILAEDLITRPKNSLINQSYHAQEMTEPLNGDGFGLGWYAKKIRPEPGLYKSITPAWNDQNLKVNAGIIKSNCLMAHVRAATEGEVALQNNHPFRHQQYLMMHNGGIMEFGEIKRDLINLLSNHYYQWIYGATDSEHIFALYMQTVSDLSEGKDGDELSLDFLADCFEKTFEQIENLKQQRDVTSPSVYNMVVTDGARMLATRYSTDPDNESRTLYFSKGRKYVCEGNVCKMLPGNGQTSSILVVSEKLDEFVDEWIPVADNQILMIDSDLSYSLRKIG
jgi:predicted glutamine amidotransferase